VRHARGSEDITGQTVTSDALGDQLMLQVLSNIGDGRERALLFAHVALGLTSASLARTFGQDRKAVEATIASLLGRLRADEDLRARFSGVCKAGRPEHHLDLAAQLGIQSWFCATCGRFIAQSPGGGRPRITCGNVCRQRRSRARYPDVRPMRPDPATRAGRPPQLVESADEAEATRDNLRKVIRNLDPAADARLTPAEAATRNKAIILLGFTCPVQLSPATLTDVHMDNVIVNKKGLEIIFRWGADQTRQYVTMPPDPEPAICPVRAVKEWRALLRQRGLHSELLFEELARDDEKILGTRAERCGGTAANLIGGAVKDAGLLPGSKLRGPNLLPAYLKEAADNVIALADLVSRLRSLNENLLSESTAGEPDNAAVSAGKEISTAILALDSERPDASHANKSLLKAKNVLLRSASVAEKSVDTISDAKDSLRRIFR
jgi:hypothetical protein